MTITIVDFARRCRDCRNLIPAGEEGREILGRLLCCLCAPETECEERGL